MWPDARGVSRRTRPDSNQTVHNPPCRPAGVRGAFKIGAGSFMHSKRIGTVSRGASRKSGS